MNSPINKIFAAAKRDDFARVKTFIEKENVAPNVTDYVRNAYGDFPMTIKMSLADVAAANRNWEMFKYIVDKDPSILAKDEDKHAALREVIKRGALDIVKYLFEKYRMNIDGNEPLLFLAIEYQRQDIVQYFIEEKGFNLTTQNKMKENLLYKVVTSKDDPDFIKYLLDEKKVDIDVNHRNERGETLVYLAALNNRTATLQYLVSKKEANINIPDEEYERTPLHRAVFKNHFEISKYLVDQGADINKKDRDGNTPLDCAASPEMWQYLIEHGANVDVNRPNNCNKTPLLSAALLNRRNLCAYLLDHLDADSKRAPLHRSVSKKRAKVCECFVEHGANVNQKNSRGETPLHLAVQKKIDYLSKYLILHGANVNLKNNKGETPLHYAVRKNDTVIEMFKYLIEHGADVNEANYEGKTPLHYAIDGNQFKKFKYLIEHGASINEGDHEGTTPLLNTILRNSIEMFNYLIERGADVNKRNNRGESILEYAVEYNQLEMCKSLVQHHVYQAKMLVQRAFTLKHYELAYYLVSNVPGVDMEQRDDRSGKTLLHLAVSEKLIHIIDGLTAHGVDINIEDNKGKTPLQYCRSYKVCKYLVEHGADVNHEDNDGKTLLHEAGSFNEDAGICKYLLKCGANVNCADKTGQSALHEAVRSENIQTVELLLAHGANIKQKTKEGNTALHLAALHTGARSSHSCLAMLKFLIEQNVSNIEINAENNNGDIPLHIAASSRYCVEEKTKYLIVQGADIKHKNKEGNTALHLMAGIFSLEGTCKYLLEHGADVNAQNIHGQTSLHKGVRRGYVNVLLAHGANINQKDEDGNTPLHLAALSSGCLGAFEDLVKYSDKVGINAENIDGQTALHFASGNQLCGKQMIKYLIAHGALINHKNKRVETPLHYGLSHRMNFDAIECLVENGAYVNQSDIDGSTPLHLAISRWIYHHKDAHVVKYFIKHGSDIDKANNQGETPVHLASKLDIVNLLPNLLDDQRANINARRKGDFWTPLHCAAFWDHYDCCKYLIEHGADTRAQDKDGKTPVELASDKRLIKYMRNVTTKRGRRSAKYLLSSLHPNSVSYNYSEQYRRIGNTGGVRLAPSDTNLLTHVQSLLSLASALFQNSNVSVRQRSEMQSSTWKMNWAAEVAVSALSNFEVS